MIDNELSQKSENLRAAISQLQGVRDARIEMDPAGISAVRVVLEPDYSPDDAIREIRSLASSELGVIIDPSIIEVIEDNREQGRESHTRHNLAALTISRSGNRFTAQAILDLEKRDYVLGDSDAAASPPFERRAVARAVIEAVTKLLDEPVELETIDEFRSGADRLVVVTIALGAMKLVGSAVVKRDEYDAIARATLCALNRFLDVPTSVP